MDLCVCCRPLVGACVPRAFPVRCAASSPLRASNRPASTGPPARCAFRPREPQTMSASAPPATLVPCAKFATETVTRNPASMVSTSLQFLFLKNELKISRLTLFPGIKKQCVKKHHKKRCVAVKEGELKAFLLISGGSCVSKDSARVCECVDGYFGKFCENSFRACLTRPCQGAATCVDLGRGAYRCLCPPGQSGRHCETRHFSEVSRRVSDKEFLLVKEVRNLSTSTPKNKILISFFPLKRWLKKSPA
jgi:hypothetical protein